MKKQTTLTNDEKNFLRFENLEKIFTIDVYNNGFKDIIFKKPEKIFFLDYSRFDILFSIYFNKYELIIELFNHNCEKIFFTSKLENQFTRISMSSNIKKIEKIEKMVMLFVNLLSNEIENNVEDEEIESEEIYY